MTPVPLPHDFPQQIERALQEDIGAGDLTAGLIPQDARGRATVITREAAIVCGLPYVEAVFARLDGGFRSIGTRARGPRSRRIRCCFKSKGLPGHC